MATLHDVKQWADTNKKVHPRALSDRARTQIRSHGLMPTRHGQVCPGSRNGVQFAQHSSSSILMDVHALQAKACALVGSNFCGLTAERPRCTHTSAYRPAWPGHCVASLGGLVVACQRCSREVDVACAQGKPSKPWAQVCRLLVDMDTILRARALGLHVSRRATTGHDDHVGRSSPEPFSRDATLYVCLQYFPAQRTQVV